MKYRILKSTTVLSSLALALIAAMATTMAAPKPASGFVSEGHVWAGVGAANVNEAAPTLAGWWGPSASVGLVANVTDFWRLTADLGVSHHFERNIDDEPAGPHTVTTAALGTRYALDIFTYVPYVGLAVGAHPSGAPSSSNPDGAPFSVRATLGVDYRTSRKMSLGGAIELSAPMTEPADFPHYSGLHVYIGYHFRRF